MSDVFPPRGTGVPGAHEATPSAIWQDPAKLSPSWDWQVNGQTQELLLGGWEGRWFGRTDDRHMVTIAGSRSGKTSTMLIPNLRRYRGSALVLDPKGELARETAAYREAMGQSVYVLDPFKVTGFQSASHNPFDELGKRMDSDIAPDAAQLAEALIVGNEKESHWTDAARNYIRGRTLYMKLGNPKAVNMRALRSQLHEEGDELKNTLIEMASVSDDVFNGIVRNIGRSYLGKYNRSGTELQGILSTAQEQTSSLDDVVNVMKQSDFELADLKRKRMTVYLVLPALRLGTHSRWLRLIIQQAFAAMERTPGELSDPPVWFVLEEFAALGYLRSIETAAGFMAGFGIKLWSVLQDLTQLKTHYPKSWETFLGNAGLIQAFSNLDLTTTEHLSKLLGQTQVIESQDVFVSSSQGSRGDTGSREQVRQSRLIEPDEITRLFARETNRQILIVPGIRPMYMNRLPREGREVQQ